MNALVQVFWKICLLRAGPQQLPTSAFLTRLTVGCYFLVGLVVAMNTLPVVSALMPAAVDTLLMAGFAYLLLWIRGLTARYTQVLTALAGSGIVLGLIGLPVVSWWQRLMTEFSASGAESSNSGVLLASWLLLWAWFFWNLVVIGQIFRHALSTIFVIGASLALLYLYVSISVSRVVYGMAVG